MIPGQISVEVHPHELNGPAGPIPCWTYVSNGLARHGQPEVVFTLIRDPFQSDPATEPLSLMVNLLGQAKEGRTVRVGDVMQFGGEKFLGGHLGYIPGPRMPGVPLPQDALGAILLTDDEAAAAQEFGMTRVMARLGKEACWYPCPPWSDPARAGISFAATRQESLLARCPRLAVPGCRVCLSNGRVVLRFPVGSGPLLEDHIDTVSWEVPFAFLTEWDPEADGCSVWEPGQTGPAAIAPSGSTGQRICGCFLMLTGGSAEDEAFGLEDGFGCCLTPRSWRALEDAFRQEAALYLPPTGDQQGFELEWVVGDSPRAGAG